VSSRANGPVVSRARREEIYREYMSFFDRAERQRRWHPEDDIPWSKLDRAANTEEMAICLETFCGVELYVPDYTANGFVINRELMGHAWFQAAWGYEESKHALVFREYLTRSGLRTVHQFLDFEDQIFAKHWTLPYATRREMICYGAVQEAATYLIYRSQREKYEKLGNSVLSQLFFLVSRDEAAHAGFYRRLLKLEFEHDWEGTLEDVAGVVFSFVMPGTHLVPDFQVRLAVEGVGISGSEFLAHAVFPMLRYVGVSRSQLMRAKRQREARPAQPAADPEFLQQALGVERSKRNAIVGRAGA
jgi:acyl-[acyl-carrier-protein] desaturase